MPVAAYVAVCAEFKAICSRQLNIGTSHIYLYLYTCTEFLLYIFFSTSCCCFIRLPPNIFLVQICFYLNYICDTCECCPYSLLMAYELFILSVILLFKQRRHFIFLLFLHHSCRILSSLVFTAYWTFYLANSLNFFPCLFYTISLTHSLARALSRSSLSVSFFILLLLRSHENLICN